MLYMFYFVLQYSPSNGRTDRIDFSRHRSFVEHIPRVSRAAIPFRVRPREVNGHAKDAGGATGVRQEIAGGAEGRAG
jgi:hypothetical protein